MMDNGYTKNASHSSDEGNHDIKAPSSLLPRPMQRLHTSQQDGQTFNSITSLENALNSMDEFVRTTAIRELAQRQEDVSSLPVERLITALSDSSWLVREAAIFTLDSLQIEVSQEHQMMALLDENEFVREAARLTFTPTIGSRYVPTTRATTRVAPTIRCGMRERIYHALHSIDSLFLAIHFTHQRGVFMAGQYPQDDNHRTLLDEITFQQSKRRRKTLSITGAILTVLVIAGLAFSWFTVLQKMPHNATGHAGNTLDKPLMSDTNSMYNPR